MGSRYVSSFAGKPESASPSSRLIGLDVLRFVAVTLVLHIHALQVFGPTVSSGSVGVLERIFDFLPPGVRGVDIFFVLSGFLVSGIFFQELARTGSAAPGRFLIRRGFKIYPAFWLLILVTVILQIFRTGGVYSKGLLAEILFFQNYVMGLWCHTWTLAVEEHFYLVLALLFFTLKRFPAANGRINLKTIPRVVDAVILGCFAARVLTWWFDLGNRFNVLWIGSVTHVRIDALFFGVWLAHGWHNCWDERLKTRIVSYRYCWAVAGLVLISSLSDRFMNITIWNIFGFILNYVGAGCLLIAALSLDYRPHNACLRFFAWLGKHSYSVYLWHMLVLEVMQHVLGGESPSFETFLIKEFLFFAVSWILGIVLARTIEFPMMRLRDKLFPARC